MAALGSRAPAGPHLAGPHSTNEIGYSVIDITSPFLGRVSAFAPLPGVEQLKFQFTYWVGGLMVEPPRSSN